jgi:hypothetical protein
MRIASISVNYIMVIPNVDGWNLSSGMDKWRVRIPLAIVHEIPVVAIVLELRCKFHVSTLFRVLGVGPGTERTSDADAIAVYLVSTAYLNMEGGLLMC